MAPAVVVEMREWNRGSLLALAAFVRLLLVAYGRVHDYLFEVAFTDVDYHVFSDAAHHVRAGRSPYDRATYRYTPLLACLLVPNGIYPDFGKVLFCLADLLVAVLCFAETSQISAPGVSRRRRDLWAIALLWLFNPLTAIVSARGNADVLVSAAVLATLYLINKDKWILAAIVHGLFAVHLKIYPIIYLPSIFLHLANLPRVIASRRDFAMRIFTNYRGFLFAIISMGCFVLSMLVCYHIWGRAFVNEFLLYHISRTDTRHNFSPYFYPLYLASTNADLSRLIGSLAFLPQATAIVVFAFRYHHDLAFCWFLTTVAFVSFNKVCTSQYFIWYICLLPIAQRNIQMSLSRAISLIALWFASQGVWLFFAYLFEFRGMNTFALIWLASLAFLVVNCAIMAQLVRCHTATGGDKAVAMKKSN